MTGQEKEAVFGHWCQSRNVSDFDLRSLIILKEFKNCLPDKIAIYINDQKVFTVFDTAFLADEYILTYKDSFERFHSSVEPSPPLSKPFAHLPKPNLEIEVKPGSREGVGAKDLSVFTAKNCGHTMNHYLVLQKKNVSKNSQSVKNQYFVWPEECANSIGSDQVQD